MIPVSPAWNLWLGSDTCIANDVKTSDIDTSRAQACSGSRVKGGQFPSGCPLPSSGPL